MDKKTALAFILIALVMMFWMHKAQQSVRQQQAAKEQAAREKAGRETGEQDERGDSGKAPPPVRPAVREPQPRRSQGEREPARAAPQEAAAADQPRPEVWDNIRVDSSDLAFTLDFTNRGAALKRAVLNEFARSLGSDERLAILAPTDAGDCALALRDPAGTRPLDSAAYRVIDQTSDHIVFQTRFADGLVVRKTFSFLPHKYHLNLDVVLKNESDETIVQPYEIVAAPRIVPEFPRDARMHVKVLIGRDAGQGKVDITRQTAAALVKLQPRMGIVRGYSDRRGTASISLTDGPLSVGDVIRIHGQRVDFTQQVTEIRVTYPGDREVREAEAGADVEIAVTAPVEERDVVLKVSKKKRDEEVNRKRGTILWAGMENKYFAVALEAILPRGETSWDLIEAAPRWAAPATDPVLQPDGRARGRPADSVGVKLRLWPRAVTLMPGASVTHHYRMFIGPKQDHVLADYPDLAGLLDFGFFGVISRLLLGILKGCYKVIPNYGVGVIILTLIVRLVLHPLSRKSQVAMQKLQKLQPEIQKLKEKYKHDKQRLGREQMELMKRHGANPLGGCLPIFFQIPIFLGLFRALQLAIELRQRPFILWVKDLSRPDTIGHVGNVPLRILPLVMVVTWIIQMKTAPRPQDPQAQQQQKIMMFMPLVFGYIMYGMASGLTLYWTLSMFFGVVEQKLIKRAMARAEAEADQAPPPPKTNERARPPAGRSKKRR